MFIDQLPEKKIGYLAPRFATENEPYEFYRMAPPGIILVSVCCGLDVFTREDVERVLTGLEGLLDIVTERDVDIIFQSGVPLPILIGLDAHDALIARIEKYTGRPAMSQLTAVIQGLQHLRLKNVLLVNKWTEEMNAVLTQFLERDGISVAGVYNKPLTPQQFTKIQAKDGAELAYLLGRQAFQEHPEADGLFIGGGNWLSQPVSEQLEAECGKPVVTNMSGMMWALLHHLGKWRPMPRRGRLLSGN